MADLSPFVYWGQNKENISLKIDLKDVENHDVDLTEDHLHVKATGLGVRGHHDYSVNLEFYKPVDAEKSKYKVTGRAIEFQLCKVDAGEAWPRLTQDTHKPAWLKIDFDNLYDGEESSSSGSDREDVNQQKEADMMERLEKELLESKSQGYGETKIGYLFIYNMFQFIGFLYIFITLQYKYIRDGEDSLDEAFENVGAQFIVIQIFAWLEVANVLAGAVRGGLVATFVQVFGRFLILTLIASEDRIRHRHVVWYLFLSWSGIELVRYPFYMLSSIRREIYAVTWLRYTLWIPLYPLGFMLEGFILILAVPFYDQTGKYTISLPNAANFAFHFPTFLVVYMIAFIPGAYMLMTHMYNARRKKLYPERVYKEQKEAMADSRKLDKKIR